jgi:hypothetical protein
MSKPSEKQAEAATSVKYSEALTTKWANPDTAPHKQRSRDVCRTPGIVRIPAVKSRVWIKVAVRLGWGRLRI